MGNKNQVILTGNPHFLVLHPYHLSVMKAQEAVISMLRRCAAAAKPAKGWHFLRLKWNDEPLKEVSFDDLVEEMRRTGVVAQLQNYLDRGDSVFGGTTGEMSSPNHQISNTVEYAGWKKEAKGPFRTCCVERELTDDLMEYRRQACDFSNEYDFKKTARAYRSFLSACVTTVDAFINRHILMARHDGFTSQEFEQLQVVTKMEEKVRLWWSVCSDTNISPFFASKAWGHFQELRFKRNEILHALDPISVYSLQGIQQQLNRVRTGIGELLFQLRKAHKKPTLGFIERLRTAPMVQYREITFKADGQHECRLLPT